MKRLMLSPSAIVLTLLTILCAPPALAQDEGQRGERRGGERRQRVDWESMSEEQRQEMRERFEQRFEERRREQAQRMRNDLELSEDEYEAIQPMIERIQTLARESASAGRNFAGDRGRGGRGGGGPNPFFNEDNASPQGKALTQATNALRESLDNTDAPSDEVKDRLAAYRQARIAMQDTLRQAREELRGYVTPRQEATLVLQGILD